LIENDIKNIVNLTIPSDEQMILSRIANMLIYHKTLNEIFSKFVSSENNQYSNPIRQILQNVISGISKSDEVIVHKISRFKARISKMRLKVYEKKTKKYNDKLLN
jgi:hypothetical protein